LTIAELFDRLTNEQKLKSFPRHSNDADIAPKTTTVIRTAIFSITTCATNVGARQHNILQALSVGKNLTHTGNEGAKAVTFNTRHSILTDYTFKPYTFSSGQIKLLACEYIFISLFKPLNILYLGCSPGNHIPLLLYYFPAVHIIGVDPEPVSFSHPHFTFHQKIWEGEFYSVDAVISDIRSGDRTKLVDEWDERTQNETIKFLDLMYQFDMPVMFKFRMMKKIDWKSITIKRFYDIWPQPFAGGGSYESRLILNRDCDTLMLTCASYNNFIETINSYRNLVGDYQLFYDLLSHSIFFEDYMYEKLNSAVCLYSLTNNNVNYADFLYNCHNFIVTVPYFPMLHRFGQIVDGLWVYKGHKDYPFHIFDIQKQLLEKGKEVYYYTPKDVILFSSETTNLPPVNLASKEMYLWVVLLDETQCYSVGLHPELQDIFNSQTSCVKALSYFLRENLTVNTLDVHALRDMPILYDFKKGRLAKVEFLQDPEVNANVWETDGSGHSIRIAGHLLNLMLNAHLIPIDFLRFRKSIDSHYLNIRIEVAGEREYLPHIRHNFWDYLYAIKAYKFFTKYLCVTNYDKSLYKLVMYLFTRYGRVEALKFKHDVVTGTRLYTFHYLESLSSSLLSKPCGNYLIS
jgi:hypothetical protein